MKVRVFHLIKSLGRGGAEVLLAEGLRVADRERFAYDYGYFLPWKNSVVPALEAQEADVVCFGATDNARILLAARHVAKHIESSGADVVHAHLPVAGVVARLAGRLAGVPVVYTEHNLMERYHPLTRRFNLLTWGLQAQAIAVSGEVEDSIRRHAGNRVPVWPVLNGVNVHTYDPANHEGSAVRDRWGIPAEAPLVGTVAVFRTQKRLDHWLEVALRVREAVPQVHFLLVGDGPLREAVEVGITVDGLGEVVHLAGLQEETRPYFAAFDAYLMTSQFEGLPIALLEAMAMAVPPVVTSVGGMPELVEDGANGYLQPFGALDGLTERVVGVLQDAEHRRALGAAARRTVVERFSVNRMQRELEAIYERVIAEHRAEGMVR